MATKKRLIYADDAQHIADFELSRDDSGKVQWVLSHTPTIAAEEIVRGRWEDEYGGRFANPRFRCSACKEIALYRSERDLLGTWKNVQALTPRCPFCGAVLDGGND